MLIHACFSRTEIRHFLQSEKDAFQAGVDYAHEFNLQNNNQTSNSGSCHTPQKSDSQKIEDAARASSYFKILRDISLPPILAPKAKVEESKRKEAILFMQVSSVTQRVSIASFRESCSYFALSFFKGNHG